MNILHVTPHLGGGVGKAHAAIAAAMPDGVQQTFLLLEAPRDRRFADALAARGATIRIAGSHDEIAQHAAAADIVQFEFWNHPRLFECLARTDFPAMRSIFWSHISGLHRPLIPAGLVAAADRFVFTTAASLALPGLDAARHTAVINSGFGFAAPAPRAARDTPRIAYLGTVDFVKMHPGFFDVLDALDRDVGVSIWGAPSVAVMAAALRMQRPHGLRFHGQTDRPDEALAQADIFFYPLQSEHYGTAENALIEAMSLGVVPVVLGNPAERAIVTHGETGLVAGTIEQCAPLLRQIIDDPVLRRRMSANAAAHVAATRTPELSADAFVSLWQAIMDAPRRIHDFGGALGATPADWFLATQGETWSPSGVTDLAAAKGTLGHFEQVFENDASLAQLRKTALAG